MYKFDHDWFSPNIPNLQRLFHGYRNATPPRILEIGALEGKSTVWFLENIPGSHVTTIDTWQGGKDHDPNNPEINFTKIKENFDFNTFNFRDRLSVMQSTSFNALNHLIQNNSSFDFAYIDGSHTAMDVNLDLILSFKLLKVDGLIYVDDYYWGFNDINIYDSPKLGIDSFVNVYANKITPLIGFANNAAIYLKVSQ